MAGALFHFAQELPGAGADVALLDGAAMYGDGRDAARKGAIEDGEEFFAAFGRVVKSAAHFHGDRNVRGHGIADLGDNLERRWDLSKEEAASAAAEDLFYGAAEVDVDDIEASG